MTTRRTFLATLPAVTLAVTIAQRASAQAAKLEESESMAVSLGYKHDAAKVDAKKFTAYATGRNCANGLGEVDHLSALLSSLSKILPSKSRISRMSAL